MDGEWVAMAGAGMVAAPVEAPAEVGLAEVVDSVGEVPVMGGSSTGDQSHVSASTPADIPDWLDGYLSKEEVHQVSHAVSQAEKHTQGEIVPIIVRSSTPVYLLRYFIFLILFVFLCFVEFIEMQKFPHSGFVWFMLPILIFFWWISKYLSMSSLILRMFVPNEELVFNVERRAVLEFHLNGVQATHRKTGILIFISLAEHKVVVLGDHEISSKLEPEIWRQICRALVESIQKKQVAAGLIQAIENVGQKLNTHFPAEKINTNELSNSLIIKN